MKYYIYKGVWVIDRMPSAAAVSEARLAVLRRFALSNDVMPSAQMVTKDLVLKHINYLYVYNIIQKAPKM